MTALSKNAVTEVLEKLIEGDGARYIYPGAGRHCTYSEGDAPSCIVGHVVAALDKEAFGRIADLELTYGESWSAEQMFLRSDSFSLGDDVQDSLHVETESTALAVALNLAQEVQDSGAPWGDAVEAYKQSLKRGVTLVNSDAYLEIKDKYTITPW